MTYKLVITSGSGPSRKVESKEYWMTQVGLCQAEEDFEGDYDDYLGECSYEIEEISEATYLHDIGI